MKTKIFIGFTIVSWLIFRYLPETTEFFYSENIYPIIAKMLHFLLGWVPFSVGDFLYLFLGIFIVFWLFKNGKLVWKKPLFLLRKLLIFSLLVFCSFFWLWGFNYFRIPLGKSFNFSTAYSYDELISVTEKIVKEANALHWQLAQNQELKVDFPFKKEEIYNIAFEGYPLKIAQITDFQSVKSVKPSFFSKILTYMGYSGYLNPFTNEAQVNAMLVGYSMPFTAAHEMAHQMGYAAEEEANFLAYLVTKKVDNQYFNYSASLFALRYLLNEVYKIDPEKYSQLTQKVNKGIFENYKEVSDFWKKYENKSEVVFKSTYDLFLKANNQKQGIRSYNLVVGLIIRYELTH